MSPVHYLPFRLNGSVMTNQSKHNLLSAYIGFWIAMTSLRSVVGGRANRVDPKSCTMLGKVMGNTES